MRTLQRLEQAGLLRLSGVRTYNAVRKTLRLTVDEVNEQVGYVPKYGSWLELVVVVNNNQN